VLADALSTAIAVAPEAAAKTILVKGGGEEAILVDKGGRLVRLRS
jgi:thiamine biosynthesis lipoprotein ApbE